MFCAISESMIAATYVCTVLVEINRIDRQLAERKSPAA